MTALQIKLQTEKPAKQGGLIQTVFDRKALRNYRSRLSERDAEMDVKIYAIPIYRNRAKRITKQKSIDALRKMSWYSNKPILLRLPSGLYRIFGYLNKLSTKVMLLTHGHKTYTVSKTCC